MTVSRDEIAADARAKAARGELLGPRDVGAIFHVGRARFGQLNRAGEFDVFKVKPAIGPKCFSGVLITRYLQGEALYEPSFGKKQWRRA